MEILRLNMGLLTDPDEELRRRGLDALKGLPGPMLLLNEEAVRKLVRRARADRSRDCRTMALDVLKGVVDDSEQADLVEHAGHMFTVVDRMMEDHEKEDTEVVLGGVRLLSSLLNKLDVANQICPKYQAALAKGIGGMLCHSDPIVRIETILCIQQLAKVAGDGFHAHAEGLIVSFIGLMRKFSDTRLLQTSIQALGLLAPHRDQDVYEDILTTIKKHVSDDRWEIRHAVVEATSRCFTVPYLEDEIYPILILILLCGYSDETVEVRDLAKAALHEAGKRYVTWKESDLVDLFDFEEVFPEDYPGELPKSSLQARMMVRRYLIPLLQEIQSEFHDWEGKSNETGGRAIHALIAHVEEGMVPHVNFVLNLLWRPWSGSPEEMIPKKRQCASLLGYFTPSQIWLSELRDRLSNQPTVDTLMTLAEMLRQCRASDLKNPDMTGIFVFLYGLVNKLPDSRELILECAESVVALPECPDITFCSIFEMLAALLEVEKPLRERINKCLVLLARKRGASTKDGLFAIYTKEVIAKLADEVPYSIWDVNSVQLKTFMTILRETDCPLSCVLEDVLPIFKGLLQPSKNAYQSFNVFRAISHYSRVVELTDGGSDFVMSCIRDCVLPSLVWSPGNTSSVLRAAAITCLYTIIQRITLIKYPKFIELLRDAVIKVTTCLMDDHDTTRHTAYLILEHVIRRRTLSSEGLRDLSAKLVAGLEDTRPELRTKAGRTLKICLDMWLNPRQGVVNTSDRTYHEDIPAVCDALLLYEEDPDDDVRTVVSENLDMIARKYPDIVKASRQKALPSGVQSEPLGS